MEGFGIKIYGAIQKSTTAMITIGLTGGFGTGKTTVLGMFKSLGAYCFSSDDIVHYEYLNNKGLQKKVVSLLGPEVFISGKIDRKTVAKMVFKNKTKLLKLNSLIHSLVKKDLREEFKRIHKKDKKAFVVVEVPLLFEAGFDKLFDTTAVVAARPAIQKKRMTDDGRFSLEDLRLRKHFQLPLEAKIKACDFIIDNNRSKKETLKQVKQIMRSLNKQIN